MKHLTQAEFDGLIAAREQRDELARLVTAGREDLPAAARAFALACRYQGFVVTIEQKALEPLAMGNHVDVVTVRPARVMAERIVR